MGTFTFRLLAAAAGCLLVGCLSGCGGMRPAPRPNILVIMSDDQSWLHLGAAGDSTLKTPAIDRLAREGIRFSHAFSASPSCSPSRAAMLSGQEIWRLREAANQAGPLDAEFACYPDLLQNVGYFIGFTGKGWEPGETELTSRSHNPAGIEFNRLGKWNPVGNFEAFLDSLPAGSPFCFWWGSRYPHRPFAEGASPRGDAAALDSLRVPPIWPRVPAVLGDIARYYHDLERFDRQVGRAFEILASRGKLDNTLIVVASDNGMPFPRAKANLYDLGVRVPLVIWWPAYVPGNRVVDDFVSLTDLAPTFLEVAGKEPRPEMTGSSLMSILQSRKSGRVDAKREFVVTARERHADCRPGSVGYPSRALRTYDFLYIRNYEPQRWPAGDPPRYGDVDSWDNSYSAPTKDFMVDRRNQPDLRPYITLCFDKRPAEELYDLRTDPEEIVNLLAPSREEPSAPPQEVEKVRRELADRLQAYLEKTGDARAAGVTGPWDSYPYITPKPPAPTPVPADTTGASRPQPVGSNDRPD